MGREHRRGRQPNYFVCGDLQSVETIRPILSTIESFIYHAGPVGSGTELKLMLNALYGVQVAATGELIGFIKWLDSDEKKAVDIFTSGPAIKLVAQVMVAGNHVPMVQVEVADKNFSNRMNIARVVNANIPIRLVKRLPRCTGK